MQNDIPPLVLTFGASDPTGATGIQADLMSFASFGCHGLSVITRLTAQDTVRLEADQPVDSEWVIDQARSLLEDIPVSAFKVGDVGSTENVTAIAEIVSDYPDLALVLAPTLRGEDDETNRLAAEEMRMAIAELLIPQTSLLVVKSDALSEFVSDYFEDAESDFHASLTRLIEVGCEYVLVTDSQEQTLQVTHSLYGSGDNGQPALVRRDSWDRLAHTFYGKTDTLAAAIAALIANGLDIPEAVGEAQEYLQQSMLAGYRLGMGRMMPDRLFWTRGDDNSPDEAPLH